MEKQVVNLNLLRKSLFVAISLALFALPCLAPPSAEAQTMTALHAFGGSGDGQYPSAGLIMDSSGNFYGTTSQGGANGYGTVFELVNSSGSYSEKVLYSFTDSNGDGVNPEAALSMDSSGNLYGTTWGGGANSAGTVFELVNSSGTYTEQVLHSFNYYSNSDGAYPNAGLIMDSSGNLYGTTVQGGANYAGTVFELVNSSGTYTEQVLYSFTNSNGDGAAPSAGVIMDSSGNLYGTTSSGGANSQGTAFELVNSSGSYSESLLYSFGSSCSAGGLNPFEGLVMDSSGNLYGTTAGGGAHGNGVAFRLSHFAGPASPTTTTLTSSPNPATAGDPLLLTATVTSSSGAVNTGTVTFYEGSTILGTQAVGSCGSASVTVNPEALGIGTYTVTAQYTPSLPAFAASTGALNQTINEAGVVLTNGNNTLDGNNTFNGNQTVDGSLNASTFVGNGSGLSNVLASGLNCTSCIGNVQLGINYAASSSQGGPAANALMLGGYPVSAFQPAGSYATTGANLFTGNQSITGNLSTTGNSATSGTTTMGTSGTPIVQHLSMTFNPTFQPIKNGCTSENFTFAGVNDGDSVALGIPNERMTAADILFTGWVSAANTVTIRACAFSTKPKNFGSGAIRVDVWQH